MPEFESIEQAVEAYATLEVKVKELEGEKVALLRKRDELLSEVKGLKTKYSRFADYVDDPDLDIAELKRIKGLYETGDSEAKSQYAKAYEADKAKLEARLAAIEKERAEEKAAAEQEKAAAKAARLRADAIAELSKESYRIRNAEQFFKLFGDKIQVNEETGQLYVGDEYKQVSVSDYITEVGNDENNAHHFKPRGGSGSGTPPNSGGGQGRIQDNPFKPGPSFNLTEQGRLFRENRQLAERLQAEAAKL